MSVRTLSDRPRPWPKLLWYLNIQCASIGRKWENLQKYIYRTKFNNTLRHVCVYGNRGRYCITGCVLSRAYVNRAKWRRPPGDFITRRPRVCIYCVCVCVCVFIFLFWRNIFYYCTTYVTKVANSVRVTFNDTYWNVNVKRALAPTIVPCEYYFRQGVAAAGCSVSVCANAPRILCRWVWVWVRISCCDRILAGMPAGHTIYA